MRSEFDIGVIGAGPGGSASAAALAERGYEVALIDKDDFPREKACGDGLTPSAVAQLEQLGLGTLLANAYPVAGYRMVLDHRRSYVTRFKGSRLGRCLTRETLDTALRDAAIERGAHFIRARASGFEPGDRNRVLIAKPGNPEASEVVTRRVVASDGATSLLRRNVGLREPPHRLRAWAIRSYYATERPLDEFFDVFLPLEVGGETLAGYGWVFPVAERVANIGVGYLRHRAISPSAPYNEALVAFVEELRRREHRRLGDIQELGKPIGAPLSSGFAPGRSCFGDLVFVGDAAGTIDPVSGEGICAALHSGLTAAEHVDRSLASGVPLDGYGRALGRALPRVGQNISVMARCFRRMDGIEGLTGGGREGISFLLSCLPPADTWEGLPATPPASSIGRFLASRGADRELPLGRAHGAILDVLDESFPFAKGAVAAELEGKGGPLHAAALLGAHRACGGGADPRTDLGARAAECLGAFSLVLSQLSNRSDSDGEKLNNSLAILCADHAVSRALLGVAEIGPAAATAFARTSTEVCEGGTMDFSDLFDLERSPERYLSAAELRTGSIASFATAMGANLAGAPPGTVDCLRGYGRMLGVAHRLAEDLRALAPADDDDATVLLASLRRGSYGLPFLLAADRDPAVKRRLVAGPTQRDLRSLLARVRVCATAEVREMLADCVDYARREVRRADHVDRAPLDLLLEWVEERAFRSAG